MLQSSFLANTTNYRAPQLTGAESVTGLPAEAGSATVLDFWQWAFSDLCSNDTRCTYAEWMIHRLFGIKRRRESWAACDAVTVEGVKIEVKTSAYIQTWSQEKTSIIGFGALKSLKPDPVTGFLGTVKTFGADLYVFCVQVEQAGDNWKALDLGQWQFYVLPRRVLVGLDQKSMRLSTVRRHCEPMTAAELAGHAQEFIQAALEDQAESPNEGVSY